MFAGGCFWFSRVDSLAAYYATCCTMEIGQQPVGLLVVSVAVNYWFWRQRSTFGWCTAALSTAVGMLVIGASVVLLLRDAPEPFGLLPDGNRAASSQWSVSPVSESRNVAPARPTPVSQRPFVGRGRRR